VPGEGKVTFFRGLPGGFFLTSLPPPPPPPPVVVVKLASALICFLTALKGVPLLPPPTSSFDLPFAKLAGVVVLLLPLPVGVVIVMAVVVVVVGDESEGIGLPDRARSWRSERGGRYQ